MHYGWAIVAASAVTFAIASSTTHTYPVFLVALVSQFGWSRASVAGVMSIARVLSGLLSPALGRLVDKLGPRKMMGVGAILVAAGYLASSQVTDLWQFYVVYSLFIFIGTMCIGSLSILTILNQWFMKRKGLAIGLTDVGTGLGVLLFVPLTGFIVSGGGWRWAYATLALLTIVIVPVALLFQRNRPADKGLAPYGATAANSTASETAAATQSSGDPPQTQKQWTIGEALSSNRFWLLFVAQTFGPLGVMVVTMHEVAMLVDIGYEPMIAAAIFSLTGPTGMVGRFVVPTMSDRFGRHNIYILATSGIIVGTATLAFLSRGSPSWLPYVATIIFGMTYATEGPLIGAAAGDLFRSRSFGTIYGVLLVGQGIGSAFGAWQAGYLFDTTGSYTVAFLVGAASLAISACCYWLAVSPRRLKPVLAHRGIR